MSEGLVTEALTALRRADLGVETGPEAAIRAVLAFRRQTHRRRRQSLAAWGAMAAGVILVLVVLHWPKGKGPDGALALEAPTETGSVAILTPAPEPLPVKHSSDEPEEIATGFFPLMESPPPFERGLLVRVTVPASTMRAVGLSVGDDHLSDPVQADVLVGQDDLARAIRFVSYRKIRD